MAENLTILLVDDHNEFREELKLWLEQSLGHEVIDVSTGIEAYNVFREKPERIDLVLADYYLSGELSNGVQLLNLMKETRENIPVIIITGGEDREISREALRAGAYWYLEKPLDRTETEVLINSISRLQVTNQKVSQLRKKTEEYYHPSLITLSQALLEKNNINSLVTTVNRQASTFLEADNCQLVLFNADTGKIQNIGDGLDSDVILSRQYLDYDLTKEIIATGKHLIVRNLKDESTSVYSKLLDYNIHAFAVAACPQKPAAPAALYAFYKTPLEKASVIRLKSNLITLARLVGLGIERIRQEDLAQSVVLAGRELLSSRTHEDIYNIVKESISKSFQVSTFYLATYDETSNRISFPLVLDKSEKVDAAERLNTKRDGGLTGHIIREGKELNIDDLSEQKKLPVQMKPLGEGDLTQAYFGVPLRQPDGKVIGTLSIQRYAPRQFYEPSKQALRNLANLIALALYRLRAEEDILTGLLQQPLVITLEAIAREVKEATGADVVTVHPYDATRNLFTPERIRLGLVEKEAKSRYYGSEIRTFERLLQKDEHYADDAKSDQVFNSKFLDKHNIVSSGGVTLKAGQSDQPIGILVVDFRSKCFFDKKLKETIRYYGRRAALAVHTARLAQRERLVNARIKAEHEAIIAIQKVENPQNREVRKRMVEEVVAAIESVWEDTDCKIVPSVLFSDAAKRQLVFAEEVAEKYIIDVLQEKGRDFIKFGEGICGWVAETGQSLVVPDVNKDERYLKLIKDTVSEICVPVKLGNRLLGVLDVEASRTNFFTSNDQIFLERIANEMAIALGASGYKERAYKVVDAALNAVKNPDKALEILVQGAHEIASISDKGPNSTTIFLRTPDGLKPVAAYPNEILPKVIEKLGPVIPLDVPEGQRRGIVARAANEEKSQFVQDVLNDPDYLLFSPDTRAELDVPILSGNDVIGVLNVEYTNAQDLTVDDQLLLESFAAQTSFIATIQQQKGEIAEKERQRSEATTLALMGIASVDQGHRWKTAASTVAGTRDLLESHLKEFWFRKHPWLTRNLAKMKQGPDPDQVMEWLNRMKRNIQIAQERPKHNVLPDQEKDEINVNIWLGRLIERWRELEEDVTFLLEPSAEKNDVVLANEFWLTRGLENLISNAARAAKSSNRSRKPTVILRGKRIRESILIEVIDNGDGIPEKVRPFLFLDTIPDEMRIGHGVGCLTTHFIMRFYGGQARLKSTGENGTIIVIELPRILS